MILIYAPCNVVHQEISSVR